MLFFIKHFEKLILPFGFDTRLKVRLHSFRNILPRSRKRLVRPATRGVSHVSMLMRGCELRMIWAGADRNSRLLVSVPSRRQLLDLVDRLSADSTLFEISGTGALLSCRTVIDNFSSRRHAQAKHIFLRSLIATKYTCASLIMYPRLAVFLVFAVIISLTLIKNHEAWQEIPFKP